MILGLPRTCPQTGLQNEPRYSEKLSEFGTVNWTPYQLTQGGLPKIQKVAAGFDGYMALLENGKIVPGPHAREFEVGNQLLGLENVKDIVACEGHIVVLHDNGTVTCIDEPRSYEGPDRFAEEVRNWQGIIQIACGFDFVLGLKQNGTLISAGRYYRCPNWIGVKQIDAFNCYYGNCFTIAILIISENFIAYWPIKAKS